MSKIAIYAIVGIVAVGVASGFIIARFGNKLLPSLKTETEQILEFVLKDYDGREIKLSDFRGKPVVVNSWAAWCPFCVKELVDFAELQEEFGEKIVVIAVDRAESLEVAKKFSDEVGVTGRITLLLDPADSFYQSIGGFSMPETVFVNSDGVIVDHKRGPMELDEMRARVKNTLNISE